MGQPLIFVPLLSMSTENLPRSEAGSASALFNMTRNIGGLGRHRDAFHHPDPAGTSHSVRIGELVTVYTPAVQERLDSSRRRFRTRASTRPRPATTR